MCNGANQGIKAVLHVVNKLGMGHMYIIAGWGRKSGVAYATEATASLAPLFIPFEYLE